MQEQPVPEQKAVSVCLVCLLPADTQYLALLCS